MTTICVHTERLAAIDLDATLPPEERAALLAHARTCAACGAALESATLRGIALESDPIGDVGAVLELAYARASSGPAPIASSSEATRADAAPLVTEPLDTPIPAPASPAPAPLAQARPVAAAQAIATPAAPKPAAPLGGYKLFERLGAGGAGIVYRATQLSVGREVALKILSPRLQDHRPYVERFLREAKAAARLLHPNVVRTFDAGFSGGRYFYAMELVPGESLRARIDARGTLAPSEALAVITDVARALAHAAEHGIVHRDVKPDNILLDAATGRAKLADLGLARIDDGGAGTTGSLTTTGTVFGTPNYMSPEQARDTHAVDARTDIYSLGATFHHALYGVLPFEAPSIPEVLARVSRERLSAPEGALAPPGYDLVIRRMTAPRRDDRYATALELIEDLEDLAQGRSPSHASLAPDSRESGEAAPPPPPRRSSLRTGTRKAGSPAVGFFAVGVVAAALGIGYRMLDGDAGARGPARPTAATSGSRSDRAPGTEGQGPSTGGASTGASVRGAPARLAAEREAATRPAPRDEHAARAGAEDASASARARDDASAAERAAADETASDATTSPPGVEAPSATPSAAANEALAALQEAARLRAAELYAARRREAVRLLGDLEAEEAAKVLAAARDDADLSPIADAIARDALEPPAIAEVARKAERALTAKAGEQVRFAMRDGELRSGVLRANGGTLLLLERGELRSLFVADLADAAIVALAEAVPGDALPAEARACLLAVRGSEGAPAAIALVADPARAANLLELHALAKGAAREAEAAALLSKADKLYESKKKAREAEKAYHALLDGFADAPSVKARASEIAARLDELAAQAAAEAEKGAQEAVLAKALKGQVKRLPDGRVEVLYDFTRADAASQRGDFTTVSTTEQRQLREGLDRLLPAVPAPYDRVAAWQPAEGGLVGRGWDRLLWKGRALGDASVEVVLTPLIERNAIVTLCDAGGPVYYAAALAYELPRFPEFLRVQFPQIFQQMDPWHDRVDACLEMRAFPDVRDAGRGRGASLAVRRQLKVKVERKTGAKGEAKIAIDVGGQRIIEGTDVEAPLVKGGFALGAWHSAIVFRSAKVTCRLDPEWVKVEIDRLAREAGEASK